MAYELEKTRLADLLLIGCEVVRIRDEHLEREATERAEEARYQTGLTVEDQYPDAIPHPTAEERRSRLGVSPLVITAELATWNYSYLDPVDAAAEGLLNSIPHRAILDDPIYTRWGLGIYTEMLPNEENELHRRWWFIVWLADRAIGPAASIKPTELVAEPISFGAGRHYAYKFDYNGNATASKTSSFATSSRALTKGRGRIPNHPGNWILVGNGVFADHWVHENGFVALPEAKII